MNTIQSCRTLRAVALQAWMMRLPLLLQDLQTRSPKRRMRGFGLR